MCESQPQSQSQALDVSGGAIYAADLYCAECAAAKCAELDAAGKRPKGLDPSNESTWDSDDYPKPADCQSEADGYQHCAGCSTFLGNDLTREGIRAVATSLQQYADFGDGSAAVLDQWADAFKGYADDDSFASAALSAFNKARELDRLIVLSRALADCCSHVLGDGLTVSRRRELRKATTDMREFLKD